MIHCLNIGAGLLFQREVKSSLFMRVKVRIGLVLFCFNRFAGIVVMFPFVCGGAGPVFHSFSREYWNNVIVVRLLSFCPWTGAGGLFQCFSQGADLLFHYIVYVVMRFVR